MRYKFLRFPEGKLRAVTFSYDDGVSQDIRFAEMLAGYGMKGTFNINSGMLGEKTRHGHRMTFEEMKEHLVARGHEIAIHGKYHVASAAASPIDCIKDALECREELESLFDTIVRGMAYPDSGIRNPANGNSYGQVRDLLSSVGIVYSRTLGGDNNDFKLPTDWLAWMPTAHHSNPKIFDWIDQFVNLDPKTLYTARNYPRLFYIWGHTYEFESDGGWEHIDKVCKAISGKEDVWYATNIEIYDYVKAYDSLIFNVNNTKVYNPTLIDVWFNADGENCLVKSGETLEIK